MKTLQILGNTAISRIFFRFFGFLGEGQVHHFHVLVRLSSFYCLVEVFIANIKAWLLEVSFAHLNNLFFLN